MKESFDVDIDERRVSFALVWRSERAGMSMILGWCKAEVVKHLGRFNLEMLLLLLQFIN